ncbi:MAG: serine/threonine protein kinase [Myxococcaceae bacterium]|nr:serine/threonine protein kinase [Myxococcaceae bacterium]
MQRGLPQAGDVVAGKYVIARLLGRGGMGAVYVVEHRITGKKLALKCLLPEHVEHPEFVERFLREAQAAGRIEHRNVVDVFDVGREGELIYIVMELLDGKPLSELLRAGQLSLEETLQILLRAMEGVSAAHAVGIVHRDLKPDNILVCVGQSGRLDDPRVLDFGISKLEDDIGKPLTKSGVMLGTPYYMAFEQINSQRDLDQRVDVYAMGVILYEAMAGQLPYVAESVGALAIRMMSGPPTPLAQLRPELPSGLSDVVMRSVARNRDERYASMRELSEALKPYCSDSASLLVPHGQGTPLGTSMRASRGIDPTLPAMARLSAPGANDSSSARLKLDGADDHSGRSPSPAASRTLLWAVLLGLAVVLGGGGLLLALQDEPEPGAALPEPSQAALPAPAVPTLQRVEAPTPAPKPERTAPKEDKQDKPEPKAPAAAEAPEAYVPAGEPASEPAVDDRAPAAGAARGHRKTGKGRGVEQTSPAALPAAAATSPTPEPAPVEKVEEAPAAAQPAVEPVVEPAPEPPPVKPASTDPAQAPAP